MRNHTAGPHCAIAVLLFCAAALVAQDLNARQIECIQGATTYRKNGWIYLAIQGNAYDRGFQHGYLLSRDIGELVSAAKVFATVALLSGWEKSTERAERLFWEKTPQEYREEMRGIADGATAAGIKISVADVLAVNGMLDLMSALDAESEKQSGRRPRKRLLGCSAFIATGNATFDGRIVMAHNTWAPYFLARHLNVILYLSPDQGHHLVMQTAPGLIHSSSDYYLTSGGLMVTETTISGFTGFDPAGVPEFVRIRRAVQYASGIDEFAEIMRKDNNGAYANDWLVGDVKTGEIACLELGLKHAPLFRTYDGYFVGSNLAMDGKVRSEETDVDYGDMTSGSAARWARWQELLRRHYGDIDIALAERFLADHYDTYLEKYHPGGRTICGHIDMHADEPLGATDGKVSDSELAARLMLWAKFGRPCHTPFVAAEFLKKNPHRVVLKPYLKDLPDLPWTLFQRQP